MGEKAMRGSVLYLGAAVLLSGCAATAIAPRPTEHLPYRALGTEPGWSLEIDSDRMHYEGDYGATGVATATPPPERRNDGLRYETDRMVVDIAHQPCSDGMSARKYPDAVTVTVGGATVHGCGGRPVDSASASLAGSEWVLAELDGRPVRLDRRPTLNFAEDRIMGFGGCNRFTGPYSLTTGSIRFGAIAATKMACPGTGMETESDYFSLLGGDVAMTREPDGALTLSGNGHRASFVPAAE
ncbi:META domain-containing protein [Stakelama saccharophila]|uniref:META domain-containing protein n=1 Tax=Stakelama saccharophila TaxID=3075605 RepID=A0ABZ0B594_9SPHN|nr:META domain-containing protein [Stakelama sp. W311]WNO52485.1 META domain-containing protein [Stakelama sp. W311]